MWAVGRGSWCQRQPLMHTLLAVAAGQESVELIFGGLALPPGGLLQVADTSCYDFTPLVLVSASLPNARGRRQLTLDAGKGRSGSGH